MVNGLYDPIIHIMKSSMSLLPKEAVNYASVIGMIAKKV
jgi:hypothetical protein